MIIAILALQGAFAEHQQMLQRLGVESVLIRNLNDWRTDFDALILPGGESTTMRRILRDEQLFDPIRQAILQGLPVFGTCAGMILLGNEGFATMDITVRRNAYGRQLGSFYKEHDFKPIGQIPMTFIRAPYIETVGPEVEVLSTLDGHIVAARQGRQLAISFHPELNTDTRVHEYFLSMI